MGGQIPGAIPSPLPTSLSNHRVSVHLLCSPFPPLTHTREFFHTHTHTHTSIPFLSLLPGTAFGSRNNSPPLIHTAPTSSHSSINFK